MTRILVLLILVSLAAPSSAAVRYAAGALAEAYASDGFASDSEQSQNPVGTSADYPFATTGGFLDGYITSSASRSTSSAAGIMTTRTTSFGASCRLIGGGGPCTGDPSELGLTESFYDAGAAVYQSVATGTSATASAAASEGELNVGITSEKSRVTSVIINPENDQQLLDFTATTGTSSAQASAALYLDTVITGAPGATGIITIRGSSNLSMTPGALDSGQFAAAYSLNAYAESGPAVGGCVASTCRDSEVDSEFFSNGSFGFGGAPFALSFQARTGERFYVLVTAIVKGGAGYGVSATPELVDITLTGGLDLADSLGLSPVSSGVYSFEALPEPGDAALGLAALGALAWVARRRARGGNDLATRFARRDRV